MTKTLTARGGALSALALVLALAVPLAPAEAQRRDGPRAERSQMRAERVAPPQRAERPARAERPVRAERPQPPARAERAERAPRGEGFGGDVMRRAQRAGEPDARPVGMLRGDAPARRADTVERRTERRADTVDRRTERRADVIERRGDRRADVIERRGDRRADRIEDRGDRRDGGFGERVDRRLTRVENRDWRGDRDRRDGRDWRDGRRDGDWRDDRRDFRRDQRNWRRDDWRWNYGGWAGWDNRDFRRWDRRWRGNRDYNWSFYRNANRFHYRPGPYYAPFGGHRYSRLSIGFYLDSLFFQPRFFINDPWDYRLPPVYGPYRWVRYYDDVVLVDVYTGEVVDVIYDFFW
jgi:hypothetical protein